MQHDLKFLRTAMIDEGIPIQVDPSMHRTDVIAWGGPAASMRLVMHPMMLLELMWHEQPTVWLAKIEVSIADRARQQADAAIARLERDGREDRALLADSPTATFFEQLAAVYDIVDEANTLYP